MTILPKIYWINLKDLIYLREGAKGMEEPSGFEKDIELIKSSLNEISFLLKRILDILSDGGKNGH